MSEKLFAALEGKGLEYTDLHRLTAAFFSAQGCRADSDALADDTLERLAGQVDAGVEIRNFVAYAMGIAHHVYAEYCEDQERFRKAAREIKYLMAGRTHDPEERPDLRRRCQKSCLKTLSEFELRLMVDYLFLGRDTEEMAEELGWPVGRLYVRIHRLNRRLGKCVKQCRARG